MSWLDAYDTTVVFALAGLAAIAIVRAGAWWFDTVRWSVQQTRAAAYATVCAELASIGPAEPAERWQYPRGTAQNPSDPSPRPRRGPQGADR